MAFDPNAATAAYIDSLGRPARREGARLYGRQGIWLLLWERWSCRAAVLTWLIVRSGVLDKVDA